MMTIEQPTLLQRQIIDALKMVYDPEISVSIWELGVIYSIETDTQNNVTIIMTLTAPNCPEAEFLPEEAKARIELIPNIGKVEINITFDPPWNMDMMSEEA